MLSIQDLTKSFGEITALDRCSFEVASGRMIGFLGPNGAGKTTAMRAIFGLVRPDSGTITWKGQPVTHESCLRFGYMPEQRGLYPKMRARDQVAYLGRLHGMTPRKAREAAEEWLDRFGLADRSADTIESLSHGNQQRVQLATALVHDPDLLVLDEPFSGLDPLAVETMSEILTEQAEAGKAVVFSSHQLDLVEDICQDVAIIHEGRIVVEGVVRTLKADAPIRHLELEVGGNAEQLLASLNGVRSVEFDGVRHTVLIEARSDVRGFLARAQEAGELHHFSYTTPSLSDLFREAVR